MYAPHNQQFGAWANVKNDPPEKGIMDRVGDLAEEQL
jgi:hypothetical protein